MTASPVQAMRWRLLDVISGPEVPTPPQLYNQRLETPIINYEFPCREILSFCTCSAAGAGAGNALAAGLRTVSDTDMGWHLATGRWVVQHRVIPSTDVLSYTAAGTRWIYPPFAGVLLYLIYGAGGYAGLSCFCALACVATVAYLVRRRDLASIVLAMCAVEPIAFRTGPRADLFNTVFLAVFLGELWAFQRGYSDRLWVCP